MSPKNFKPVAYSYSYDIMPFICVSDLQGKAWHTTSIALDVVSGNVVLC